ncbi:MAG: hypothetical protein ABGZ24_25185 [Fuerstiella sp.]
MTLATIDRVSTDLKLKKALASHNDRLAQHLKAAAEAGRPPDVELDTMLGMNESTLHSERRKRQALMLSTRQEAVKLSRQHLELLERLSPELDEAVTIAEKDVETTRVETAEALRLVGMGVETTMAVRAGLTPDSAIAGRQFNARVNESQQVIEAIDGLKKSRQWAKVNHQDIRAAESHVADSLDGLKTFISDTVSG